MTKNDPKIWIYQLFVVPLHRQIENKRKSPQAAGFF